MSLAPRISLITLGVADLERSAAFYERLGWRRSKTAGDAAVAFFALDGIVLGLFGREALAQDAGLTSAGDAASFGGVTLAQNVTSEAAVDAALAAAQAAGAHILRTGGRAFWGGYTGYFADPDGYPWEIAYNPFFPLAENGSIVLPP